MNNIRVNLYELLYKWILWTGRRSCVVRRVAPWCPWEADPPDDTLEGRGDSWGFGRPRDLAASEDYLAGSPKDRIVASYFGILYRLCPVTGEVDFLVSKWDYGSSSSTFLKWCPRRRFSRPLTPTLPLNYPYILYAFHSAQCTLDIRYFFTLLG